MGRIYAGIALYCLAGYAAATGHGWPALAVGILATVLIMRAG